MPFFIIDNLISKKKLSHSAFIIFLYLCRKANFNPSSNHFGRCWVSFKEICEVTGISVSNMRKYILELEKSGMIKCTFSRKHDESGFNTVHEFNIKILNDKRRVKVGKLKKQSN
jgi:DNA-binding MarR family transcriptional regulator